MNSPEFISVVIPTRNRSRELARAIASVRAQQDVEVQLIVVDDASDPPARVPSGVELVRNDKQVGPALARNRGAELARAPWLAFLDDDDLWAPHKLARLVSAAQEAGAEFAYSAAYAVMDPQTLRIQPAPRADLLADELRHGNAIPGGGSNVVVTTRAFEAAGGFDEHFTPAEDWELWLRLAGRESAVADDEPLIAKTLHSANTVLTNGTALTRSLERLASEYGVSLRRNGPEQQIAYASWLAGRPVEASRHYARAAVRRRDAQSLVRAAGTFVPPPLVARLRRRAPVPVPDWLRQAHAT